MYILYTDFKCNLTELTTRSTVKSCLHSQRHLSTYARIPCVLEPQGIVVVFVSVFYERYSFTHRDSSRGCFPYPASFILLNDFLELGAARSWLPKMEAPGCLRHPASTFEAVVIISLTKTLPLKEAANLL